MNGLAHVGTLIKLAFRRDRFLMTAWVIGIPLFMVAVAGATLDAYPTQADWVEHAQATTPVLVARLFNGLVYAVNQGVTVMSETLLFLTLFPALMSIFAITRHTRQNEETGRTELVAAGAVGRYSFLGAALVEVAIANVLVGTLTAVGLIAIGLPTDGSMLVGGIFAAVGLAFAGIAALCAQITTSARGANALAGAILGGAYLVRGIGDAMATISPDGLTATSGWAVWLSPIGWIEAAFPYASNNWSALILPLCFGLSLVLAACISIRHRDIGAGFLEPRRGPAHAAWNLRSSLGLAWRLQRGAFYGWLAGLLVVAITIGAVGNQIQELVKASPSVTDALTSYGSASDLVSGYFSLIMGIVGIFACGFLMQGLLRLRSEEATGHLEYIVATAVGRIRWMSGHIVVAVLGTTVIIVLSALAAAITYGLVIGDLDNQVVPLLKLALLQLPAVLVLGSIVVLAFSVLPRLAVAIGWSFLTFCIIVLYVGVLLKLPGWMVDLSPFSHIPTSAASIPVITLTLLTLIAVIVGAVALSVFRRRNLLLS